MSSNSLTFKEVEKLHDFFQENKIVCKCGHRVYIGRKDKIVCSWCGNYVYKDKKLEFKERLEHARKNYK